MRIWEYPAVKRAARIVAYLACAATVTALGAHLADFAALPQLAPFLANPATLALVAGMLGAADKALRSHEMAWLADANGGTSATVGDLEVVIGQAVDTAVRVALATAAAQAAAQAEAAQVAPVAGAVPQDGASGGIAPVVVVAP